MTKVRMHTIQGVGCGSDMMISNLPVSKQHMYVIKGTVEPLFGLWTLMISIICVVMDLVLFSEPFTVPYKAKVIM